MNECGVRYAIRLHTGSDGGCEIMEFESYGRFGPWSQGFVVVCRNYIQLEDV